MGNPPMPFEVLQGRNRTNRKTKAELRTRQEAESSLATGSAIQEYPEVRDDPDAHRVFVRTLNLLKKIKKHDAMSEAILNRYALITSECKELMRHRAAFAARATEAERRYHECPEDFDGVKLFDFYKLIAQMQNAYISCDKQVQLKRKMLLDIEKEMAMTIAAQLRSIPKKPEKTDRNSDGGLSEFLRQGSIRNV